MLAPGKLSIWRDSSLNGGIFERFESPRITCGFLILICHSLAFLVLLMCSHRVAAHLSYVLQLEGVAIPILMSSHQVKRFFQGPGGKSLKDSPKDLLKGLKNEITRALSTCQSSSGVCFGNDTLEASNRGEPGRVGVGLQSPKRSAGPPSSLAVEEKELP